MEYITEEPPNLNSSEVEDIRTDGSNLDRELPEDVPDSCDENGVHEDADFL